MVTQVYKVLVLSPVHVGNGETISTSREIVHEGSASFLIDIEGAIHLFPKLFLDSKDLLVNPSELLNYLRKNGGESLIKVVKPKIMAQEVRIQIRDGRGAPLIPGSSIKGSIRTAILKSRINPSIISKKIFGDMQKIKLDNELREGRDDCGYDYLRVLSVSDVSFPEDAVGIVQVRVRSPNQGNPTREEDYWLACEAINAQASGYMRMGIDPYLLKNSSKKRLGWNRDVKFDHQWIADVCRKRILEHIETELDYFRRRSPLKEAENFLQRLKQEVTEAPKETIFLRLGYGIGWCGTTGEIIDPRSRLQLLSKKPNIMSRLAASVYDEMINIFPKTRRYIKTEPQVPLFGFLRLDLEQSQGWKDVPFQPKTFIPKMDIPTNVVEVAKEEKRVSQIEMVLSALRPHEIKGRFDGLMKQIEAIEEEEERVKGFRGLAMLIRRHIPSKDKNFYKRPDVIRCLGFLEEEK